MNTIKTLTVLIVLSIVTNLYSQTSEPYQWNQVKIGGGGYITGMKIHPLNSELQYFRTDVGGAYRWDDNEEEMIQIINFPDEKKSYYGVAGIALHPTNEDIIYLAVDRGNNTQTSKILYSINKGNSWQEIDVPEGVKFGANGGREGGTGINDTDREGSPIEISPSNTNELWIGTREKGLWILDVTKNIDSRWRKITSIPDNENEGSIRSVKFRPNNPNDIFIGYATKGIYRSTNGGQSFDLINNGNSDLEFVADMSFSMSGDKLYVAAKNAGIYKLTNPNNSTNWEQLTIPDRDFFRGYQTVTASPHDNNLVIASVAANFGNNLARLQVSTNGGVTWTQKSQTNITNLFTWSDASKEAGAHTSQIAFDPNDPNKLFSTSWFGLWHTDNWNQATVAWENERARGHEEIVTSGLFAFPENNSDNKLGINSADYVAIISKDLDSYDNRDVRTLIDNRTGVFKGVDIAACEKFPNNYILSSTDKWEPTADEASFTSLLYTSDGGDSYERLTSVNREWGRTLVAMASNDPSNFIAVHGDQIHFTRDRGASFSLADAPPLGNVVENNVFTQNRPLASDFVLGNTFYLYDRTNGAVYTSINGGETWTEKGTLPVNDILFSKTSIQATPGKAGHLWFNHPRQGLYRSEDSGATWNQIDTVDSAKRIAIGKSKTDTGYPTLYFVGTIDSDPEEALYKSADEGASWIKINDNSSLFLLSSPRFLAADRSIYGKIYIGVSGLGVWQGSMDATLSVNELTNQNNTKEIVNIYPNPTRQIININGIKNNTPLKIYDINGRLLISTTVTKKIEPISIAHLTKGIYLLKIGTQTVKQIIKI